MGALRLYTTACYKSLNGPLRDAARHLRTSRNPSELQRRHPFPICITFLSEGIKRLRAVGVHRPSSSSAPSGATGPRDLYRGLRNVELGEAFQLAGGTEVSFEPGPVPVPAHVHVHVHGPNRGEPPGYSRLLLAGLSPIRPSPTRPP